MSLVTRMLWALLAMATPAVAAPLSIHTLDNGLTVILKEEHKAPVVSFQVWYKVGSVDEVGGKTGLSHMLEHMMFKGTPKHGKGEYSRLIAKYGGTENAFTSRDYTAYYMNWAPQHLSLSVELEADRMRHLLLDADEFATEREVVREERRMRIDDNPVYATVEQLYASAYLAHPYRQPVIGWMSELAALSREDAAAHYNRYYTPNNATVVVVGDFDADALLKEIRAKMGTLPAGPPVPPRATIEPQQNGERRVVLHREAQLPFIIFGYPVPNWENEDAYPLMVLSQILFEGKRSRMYQRLTYTDQSAVDAGGDYEPLNRFAGLFYFHAMIAADHTPEEVEAAIHDEVKQLQNTPPEARELTRAKNQIEARFLLAQDSVYYQAMTLGEAATVGAGADYVEQFPKRVGEVSAADVSRVAQKYLLAERRTVATLIPQTTTDAEAGQ